MKLLLILGALFAFPFYGYAHPVPFIAITTDFAVSDSKLTFETRAPYVFEFPRTEKERLKLAEKYFREHLEVTYEDIPCALALSRLEKAAEQTTFGGEYMCRNPIQASSAISITSTLWFDVFENINHFIKFQFPDSEEQILLTKNRPASGEIPPAHNAGSILKQFLDLGILHILFGLDHVLFVLALHCLVRTWKEALVIVTAFTIAHSLTLILAGLHLVTLTSRFVEPVIALSIAYTAWRNIHTQRKNQESILQERGLTAFGFGLIHGLGFAGALSEVHIPEEFFFPALLAFNGGIEIGQLIIVVLFLSLLRWFQKLGRLREAVYIFSGTILLISVIWAFERIFLP